MTVDVKQDQGKQVVQLEPTDPKVIYVPQYNPDQVFGTTTTTTTANGVTTTTTTTTGAAAPTTSTSTNSTTVVKEKRGREHWHGGTDRAVVVRSRNGGGRSD